jgi:hypothetical protein
MTIGPAKSISIRAAGMVADTKYTAASWQQNPIGAPRVAADPSRIEVIDRPP